MISQHQFFNPQMKSQAVSGSDISISKANSVNICLNTLKVTTDVPSDIDHHTSCLITQNQFVTSLSCDLEPDTTMTISWKIFISADLDPYLSEGLYPDHGTP